MNAKVLLAVFKRNLGSYFYNPTGYLFLCVFVLLSAFAAFWPHEFFNANLANLNQLNWVFPFIMLVFVPAITMSMWADERRQGTDELLLTIPATDFDIVLGKYLAAVAIFSISLLFSLICNYAVLRTLGQPDVGLFLATYIGYWLIGLGMLAIGMVASFLTPNLTVAYILGALFNVPLVFLAHADTITQSRQWTLGVKQWSVSEQFRDFGRGIVSLGGVAYFAAVVAVMLYLSMVLISRRHWSGRSGGTMGAHYLVRALSLVLVALSAITFFHFYDLRADITSERLSSLSPETVRLLGELKTDRPVQVEAFVSPEVPEGYVQTQLNLISMLQELQARGGEKVRVRINSTERFSEEAARAEKRYDITARRVVTQNRGTLAEDHVFMGVAFTCGLQKVILPFIDRGIPVEYELVRSLATVTQQNRKKVGVLQTDAKLYGGFNMQSMSSANNWPIIDELEKQYDVEQVDPANPITKHYDVLLAVQPSSLAPEQLDNFIAAVKNGQATAIFEDPFPVFAGEVPATSAPRRPPGGMNMFMQQQPLPKGNIASLWALLGVDFADDQVIWQGYNPYPKLSQLPEEFVFVDRNCGAKEPFGESDSISSGLQHLLFPFPGAFSKLNASNFELTALVRTGEKSSGTVRFSEIMEMSPFGPMGGLNANRRQVPGNLSYILAAHVRGKLPAEPKADDAKKDKKDAKTADTAINVVLVADIDMLHQEFFRLREQGEIPEAGINFDFDNVTFVLNVLDSLADDKRFLELRKRRPMHRTLSRIDESTEEARKKTEKAREQAQTKFDKAREEEEKTLRDNVAKLEERMKKEKMDLLQIAQRVDMIREDGERRMQAKLDQLKQERDRETNHIDTEWNLQVRSVQRWYRLWAVLLPPIPPLLVAGFVFAFRRYQEREGVSRSRLRS
jgi:ABC-2 type transport system permease protein